MKREKQNSEILNFKVIPKEKITTQNHIYFQLIFWKPRFQNEAESPRIQKEAGGITSFSDAIEVRCVFSSLWRVETMKVW